LRSPTPADARYHDANAVDDLLAGATLFTTDEVLAEFLTFFAGDAWLRNRAAETVLKLLKEPDACVVAQSREFFLAGLELYRQRPDKSYSLTDWISMRNMRQHGIGDVLTNDRHFEQEGFRALFREP